MVGKTDEHYISEFYEVLLNILTYIQTEYFKSKLLALFLHIYELLNFFSSEIKLMVIVLLWFPMIATGGPKEL